MKCDGCTALAHDLKISETSAHDLMLNSKIIGNKDILRYHIQPELVKHGLKFESVYQKIEAHKPDCIYYSLL